MSLLLAGQIGKIYWDTKPWNCPCFLTASTVNPSFLRFSSKAPKFSNRLFLTPSTEMAHNFPHVSSPSVQWVINPTCSTTGVFLVVFRWRALIKIVQLPNQILEKQSHLCSFFPKWKRHKPPQKTTSFLVHEALDVLERKVIWSWNYFGRREKPPFEHLWFAYGFTVHIGSVHWYF